MRKTFWNMSKNLFVYSFWIVIVDGTPLWVASFGTACIFRKKTVNLRYMCIYGFTMNLKNIYTDYGIRVAGHSLYV